MSSPLVFVSTAKEPGRDFTIVFCSPNWTPKVESYQLNQCIPMGSLESIGMTAGARIVQSSKSYAIVPYRIFNLSREIN